MATSHQLGREVWSWAAQVIWITGTLGALIAGYTAEPMWGLAVLGGTFVLTLACGWGAARWNAIAAVFAALALQAVACGSMGAAALDDPLGYHRSWWSMSNELDGVKLLLSIAPSFIPAALLGAMLRMERSFALLRRGAPMMLPVALAASVALSGLAAYRAARYPTAECYGDSLPLVATVAGLGDACRESRLMENGGRYCESPPQDIAGHTVFYACEVSNPSRPWCQLKQRETDGSTQHILSTPKPATTLDVVRDERLGLLIRDGKGLVRLPSLPGSRSSIRLRDIREHIAPPTSWLLLAVLGLGVAILAQLGRHGFARLLGAPTRAHADWHARLRGDLSVVSIATLAVTHALLVAALVRGFLI